MPRSPDAEAMQQDADDDEENYCSTCFAEQAPVSLRIAMKRDPCSAWISDYNLLIGSCFGSNHNIQYVLNCLISLYAGMYGTKSCKENAESLEGAVGSIMRTLVKLDLQASRDDVDDDNDANRFSRGLRMLNAGWRGLSGSEVIGSPRAALFLLSADYAWLKSHDCVNFAPTVCRDLMLNKPVIWVAAANGTITLRALDYMHRPHELEALDPLSFFENWQVLHCPNGKLRRRHRWQTFVRPQTTHHPTK